MQSSDTEMFPLSMYQIAAKQLTNNQLKQRMSQKTNRTYMKLPTIFASAS